MRICFLAGPGSIHVQRWVNWLVQNGHDVHIIFPESLFTTHDTTIPGASMHPFKTLPVISPTSHLMLHPLDNLRIKCIIREINPDVLHAHYLVNYGFKAASSGFHPLVLSAWGSDVLVQARKSAMSRREVDYTLHKADIVTATSEYLRGVLINEFGISREKVVVVPWGTDLGIFHKGYEIESRELRSKLRIQETSFIMLSPRIFGEHYRIEFIVRAMAHIVSRYPDVVLVVVGGLSKDIRYKSKINDIIANLGIEKNVKILNYVLDTRELAVLYNISNVLVSIPRTDQFSACIMEGMICGAIPIVNDLEVYRQYLKDGENVLFVEPENPQDIADKVIYCIEHPEYKDKCYKINREIIESKEDWKKNAPLMVELYNELVGTNNKK